MKRWWDGLKISHKIVWAFLGLIAFPFSLLLMWNFGSFAVQYEQQLSQSGQYMLGMVVQDVNESWTMWRCWCTRFPPTEG